MNDITNIDESNAQLSYLGSEIWSVVNQLVDYKLNNMTSIKSARVVAVNNDETVDLVIPPDSTVYHHIQNQSIYELHPGDNVKIIKENNNLSNTWVIGGFGLKTLKAYPVGSYYWSTEPTDPSQLFGGIWQPVTGKFILASGEIIDEIDNKKVISVGETGGLIENEMKIKAKNLPALTLSGKTTSDATIPTWAKAEDQSYFSNYRLYQNFTDEAEQESIHINNMPPYEAAYCWKRVS